MTAKAVFSFFMGETNHSRQETIRGMVLGVDRSVFKAQIKSHKNAFKNARGDSPQIHQKNRQALACLFFIQVADLAYHHRTECGVYHQPLG